MLPLYDFSTQFGFAHLGCIIFLRVGMILDHSLSTLVISMRQKSIPLKLVGCLALFCTAMVHAENPSIMFKDQNQAPDYLVAPAATPDQDAGCAELARQIESLRGKPQRRYIAMKRYDLECKGGSIDYERLENEGFTR